MALFHRFHSNTTSKAVDTCINLLSEHGDRVCLIDLPLSFINILSAFLTMYIPLAEGPIPK